MTWASDLEVRMRRGDASHHTSHPPFKQPSRLGRPLRFGIDIDGTISQAPRRFSCLIEALLNHGNHVYIITGRLEDIRQETEEFLRHLGIQYTELIMRPTNWPGTIADFKVRQVRDKRVHMMIDNSEETCWAIEQQTEALAAHMLPIPEMPEARQVKDRMRREGKGDGAGI